MSESSARPRGTTKALLSANAVVVYVFFYAPIILLLIFSVSDNRNVGTWGGFTFDWYREFADNEPIQDAIWVSLRVAFVTTVVSVVLGTMAALALVRFRFRGQRVFDALLYLPSIIPDVTMAVMLLLFFSRSIDIAPALCGTPRATAHTTIRRPDVELRIRFVSVVCRGRLPGMDARLDEAAL